MHITFKPPAKINLSLWVHGRRDDGFHELSTVFQEIPICDFLVAESSNQHEFICDAFPGNDNLCTIAWKNLEKHVKKSLPAKITLTKHIPAAAGLGGASSDATYTLKALNQLHHLNLSNETLKRIAATFGSDTAFFVEGGCQVGYGRGEKLHDFTATFNGHLLLAVPHCEISTPPVFKALKSPFSPEKNQVKDLERALKTGTLSVIRAKINNDLTPAAQSIETELKKFMDHISHSYNTTIFLSGSGSSCYAIDDKPFEAHPSFEGRYLGCFNLKNNSTLWEITP